MFTKKITPFTCIVIAILVCLTTCVAVSSISSVGEKQSVNDSRLDSADLTKYADLLKYVGDDYEKFEKLAYILTVIDTFYVHDYDVEQLWNDIYTSLPMLLGDEYSQYFSIEDYNELIDSSDSDFVGIGVHVSYDVDTEGVYVFGVMPNSPALKAGVQVGDIIVNVEGIESTEENYYKLLDAVRGEAGSNVKITVLRGEERIELNLTRAAVEAENVLYQKLDNNTAYVRILSFAYTNVADEFTKKIALAQSEGCDKFIFDVRHNGGGFLDQICKVLDLLLPEGPIINIVDKNGKTTTQNSDSNCITAEMVVLCNEGTASAAELFSAALRDYKLAKIVGVTTFGKGSMQSTRILPDGSAIKLSSALYNPPSNVSYDKIGIKPDYEIDLSDEWKDRYFKMPIEEDVQLQKAIELLGSAD